MTDTLERREAIRTAVELAVQRGRLRPQDSAEQCAEVATETILAALTTSPRIEPIAVATTWSGSATIGDPAMPKVDSAFSISRRRHEDRFTPSPRVDEELVALRAFFKAVNEMTCVWADSDKPSSFHPGSLDECDDDDDRDLWDAFVAARTRAKALATTPADPRVGKIEADLEAAKKVLAVGERFVSACFAAWAAGEPEHRVRTMLDLADEFRSTLSQIEDRI